MLRLPNLLAALRQWREDRKLQRSIDRVMASAVTLPGPPAPPAQPAAITAADTITVNGRALPLWQPQGTLAPQPSGWVAMPGNVLELRDTGFSIKLSHNPREYMYTLTGPGGAVLWRGGDLSGLKELAERLARDHEEFVPRWVR